MDESLARRRFSMLLLTLFAALALGLAAIGIYGVVAYLVDQGTREIGIRMALGATPRGILLLIVRHGLASRWPAWRSAIAGAFVLTRFMRSLLFGVAAQRPVTFAGRRRAADAGRAGGELPAGAPRRADRSDGVAARTVRRFHLVPRGFRRVPPGSGSTGFHEVLQGSRF